MNGKGALIPCTIALVFIILLLLFFRLKHIIIKAVNGKLHGLLISDDIKQCKEPRIASLIGKYLKRHRGTY